MINRLPIEFRVPAGAKGAAPESLGAADAAGIGARALERAAACIGAYPTVSLAAAFVAGLAIGRLVKT